ncbi:MAG: GTP-binding protein [Gracilibacteraceae bacterium]|jgi:G3E family GTPase|nr:GTP-binding protein [Gracilibacteraceae bacterium]
MTAEIFIISGFLGAGKTTLIQKLLREALVGEKTAIVENDFGEISVDAALLRTGGIEVTELNSGCICCGITGDFVKSLRGLLTRFEPRVVLIEPSGVGKLSDIAAACAGPDIGALASVRRKITVVDVKRCQMYRDNFGEFFIDQIENADLVLLSRTEDFPGRAETAREIVREINARADVLTQPWADIDAAGLLYAGACEPEGCEHDHDHDHDHDHEHGHDHMADEIFDTVTIRTDRFFSREELQARLAALENAAGLVLRAKGVMRGPAGNWNLQYLPGDWRIERCAADGGTLCIIGRDLNQSELAGIFGGVPA